MRALVRFRLLLPALGLPACVAVVGVGVQAAAFRQPSEDALVTAQALQGLIRYRIIRGTEQIGGRSVSTACVEGRFHMPRQRLLVRGALVLLGNGERLYDFGDGVRRVGRRGPAPRVDRIRFLLAGCPRMLDRRIGSRLVRGLPVEADPARGARATAVAIAFADQHSAIALYVDRRTFRPLELTLRRQEGRAWSDLEPGGGRPTMLRVRRAFGLWHKRKVQRA